ncbi:hypothetical protein [Microbispora sp. KK1-11]|uniref:hypothetical protein n=1 Tax=Microbispora sp. KK1-11 TaxID=2053005 RepID=UPI0021AF5C0C|nr:hypothetical protein [Microbispora sp. KK1-11]
MSAVAEHLVAHATALSYALAQVNLVAPGQGGRLDPVRSAFCYSRSLAPDDPGHVAVLSVTDGRARRSTRSPSSSPRSTRFI